MDDKRVSKMTLETAQLYCTATGTGPYRPTHTHHPITAWAKHSIDWVAQFHIALATEHFYRKQHVHKSFIDVGQYMEQGYTEPRHFINYARSNHLSINPHKSDKPREIPIDFTHISDVHYAYRLYLRARWFMDTNKPIWTRRPPPFWLNESITERCPPIIITQQSIAMTSDNTWQSIAGPQ